MSKTNKRIAIVANTTWNIYNFRMNVIGKLLEEGYEVSVIAPVDEYIKYKEQFPEVRHVGLRFLSRDSKNPFKDLLLIEELRRKYKRGAFSLILHYTHKPNIYGTIAAKINGIPCISAVTGLGYSFINKGYINSITRWLYRMTQPFSKEIIFENQDDLTFFRRLKIVDKNKGKAIKGCGVDLTFFQPSSNGIYEHKTILTFVGRLLKDKGITEFVEAGKLLKQTHPNVELWVIGELDDNNPSTIESDLLVEWVNNKDIVYHGFVKDVRKLIKKSNCVILPSYREGMPRIVLEGVAMGKPIITTNVPGCRETVEDNITGYLVPSKDVKGLHKGMEKFMELSIKEQREMGNRGRQKAELEFGENKIANEIYEIIESCL